RTGNGVDAVTGSNSIRDIDPGSTPNGQKYKDLSRMEVVLTTTAADGRGRELRYEGAQLTEVKSTFTGHTWKRSEVDGKEEWINEKGTVWKGKFSVGPDGDLTFTPHDGKTAFVFTPDGKTLRVPVEATAAQTVAPAEAQPAAGPAKQAEAPGERVYTPAKSADATEAKP